MEDGKVCCAYFANLQNSRDRVAFGLLSQSFIQTLIMIVSGFDLFLKLFRAVNAVTHTTTTVNYIEIFDEMSQQRGRLHFIKCEGPKLAPFMALWKFFVISNTHLKKFI